MRGKIDKKEQLHCETFNAKYPLGTMVDFWTGLRAGEPSGTSTTRSEAELLGGHTAVVWLEGVRGCIALSHVKAH
jgi:hypothetical protein